MAVALSPYGGAFHDIRICGPAAFVRSLRPLLAEDKFDRQPLCPASRRWLFAADVRIDNRAEVEDALGWTKERTAGTADSDLLAAAWERWGEGALERVIGDFSLAVWHSEEGSLRLARSALALKPLFYHVSPRFWAFASAPQGLHAISAVPKALDFDHAAAIGAHFGISDSGTIFAAIRRVEHGQIVRLSPTGTSVHRFWKPRTGTLRYATPSEYVDQFREVLGRAVRSRLRRPGGLLASQLSAGRDSSAVTATAAGLLAGAGESLLAITAAPPAGCDWPTVGDRLADESVLAAQAVAGHDNVRHLIRRPSGTDAIQLIREVHRLSDGPLRNPTNIIWWEDMHAAAREQGASVLLFGSSGNFTISAGGSDQLRDVLVEKGLFAWLAAAAPIGGLSWNSWRHIASLSFGPSLPTAAYRGLLRATGRSNSFELAAPMLRSPYRRVAEQRMREAYGDPRPPCSNSANRRRMLLGRDLAELTTLARWGIDPRDPTADLRLAEFCLSIPSHMMLGKSETERPLYERAMADRLPPSLLHNRRRGYQTPEWFRHFEPKQVREAFRCYGRNPHVAELLDLDHINAVISRWPGSGWEERLLIYLYRNNLIGTLALADFIDLHFPI